MVKNLKITEDDSNTLNFGIPIVLTLFFFIVNGMLFSAFFAEGMLELLKIYLFFFFVVLTFDFIQAKRKKEAKTIINVNAYKNIVLSTIFVLLFLGMNFISSKTIFETKIACDEQYQNSLKKYAIPPSFNKFYKLDLEELRTCYRSDYYLHIKVDESIFGYKILKQRTFEKATSL